MAAEEDEEELSPEEKLAISKKFILSSPAGEIGLVTRDVQKLTGSDVLTKSKITDIYDEYYKAGRVVTADNGDKVLICAEGAKGGNKFFNPATSRVYGVSLDTSKDSLGPQWTAKDEGEEKDDGGEYQQATAKAVGAYFDTVYAKKGSGQLNSQYGVYSSGDTLTIVIYGENLKLSNFWCGSWRSRYTIDVSSQGSASLKGKLTVNAHYFEDGNVQLNSSQDVNEPVKVGEASATGKAIADAISQAECAWHSKLAEYYATLKLNFKALRRALPKTGQKFGWDGATNNLIRELGRS